MVSLTHDSIVIGLVCAVGAVISIGVYRMVGNKFDRDKVLLFCGVWLGIGILGIALEVYGLSSLIW
jgi:hypothetical protein